MLILHLMMMLLVLMRWTNVLQPFRIYICDAHMQYVYIKKQSMDYIHVCVFVWVAIVSCFIVQCSSMLSSSTLPCNAICCCCCCRRGCRFAIGLSFNLLFDHSKLSSFICLILRFVFNFFKCMSFYAKLLHIHFLSLYTKDLWFILILTKSKNVLMWAIKCAESLLGLSRMTSFDELI